jgi:hypothetical protein
MAPLVFAALIVTVALAISWGTVAVALWQSPREEVAIEEAGPETGWPITPAHFRIW